MIIDDDSYLYVEKLKMFLSFFNKNEPLMIGDYLNWTHLHSTLKYGGNYQLWISGGPGIVFTKSSIIKFIEYYNKFTIPYINHDVWLTNLFRLSNGMIKRVHCPGFHQYLNEDILNEKNPKENNNLVSIHLNRNMSLLSRFHIN
jgi:hypothetical protein